MIYDEIINGDCLDVLKNEADGQYDLIMTSPPYNVGKSYESKTSITEYLENQEEIIGELVRVLSDEGNICWQVGTFVAKGEVFPLDIYYYSIFKRYGLQLRNRIVWHYGHGLHSSNRFSGRYETILWFTKTKDYIFNLDNVRVPSKYPNKKHFKGEKRGQLSGNPLGKNPSDVWEIVETDWDTALWNIPNVKAKHPEKTEHPCQFPIELVERCVLALSNRGGWVLDPFAGAGSTVIGAIKNNRNAVGIEKEKRYCKIAKQRINDFRGDNLKIRPITKPIHGQSYQAQVLPIGTNKITIMEKESNNPKEISKMNKKEHRISRYLQPKSKTLMQLHAKKSVGRKENIVIDVAMARTEGQNLIKEMVDGGATKSAIAKAVGVSNLTIISISKGTTAKFRKLSELQKVYMQWKAGKLDLSSKRGKKTVSTREPETERRGRKPMSHVAVLTKKKRGRPKLDMHMTDSAGFDLPKVTDKMIAEVERQIANLQYKLKFMKDIIAIRKKYGQWEYLAGQG